MKYSYNNEYPLNELPHRIRLSSGITRTDNTTFTDEEIIDAGYRIVNDPPDFNNRTQKLEWIDGDWLVSELSEQELEAIIRTEWYNVRNIRNEKIENTIWRIQRYESECRLGISRTDDIVKLDKYIQDLRDITNQPDPLNIIWPTLENYYVEQGINTPI
jgi:hypothetical protein